MKGVLFVVSTPIGNLEDITLRALRVLKEVDLIAAEDTRRSIKLLNYYGISKPMISYWREKEKARSDEIIVKLHNGRSVALISDAGTPGIADPGTILIKKAAAEGIAVVPVPGPTAFVAALSVSGLATEEFSFLGFLPSGKVQRGKMLDSVRLEQRTLIFYEAPHRVLATLEDMAARFANRRAVLVREVSKVHEEVLRGIISEILERIRERETVGEYVIMIEGRAKEDIPTAEDALFEVLTLMKRGLGRREAARRVAKAYGLSKKQLYDRSLAETS